MENLIVLIIYIALTLSVLFSFFAVIVFSMSMAGYRQEAESKRLEYSRKLILQLLQTIKQ